MTLQIREMLKRLSYRAFRAIERLGVHVLPVHYYSPVANRRWLRANEHWWRRRVSLEAVDCTLDQQVAWLRDIAHERVHELPLAEIDSRLTTVGPFRYGPIEAQLLHAVVRSLGPSRIVEVGSGSTTLISSMAVDRNLADGRDPTEIIAIDPYCDPRVDDLPHVTVRRCHALEADIRGYALGAGDLLFIDSTHAVRTGSEVAHLYLEIIPHLPPDVLIHIHDIYFPYLFSPSIYTDYFDWQETTLVAALLTDNTALRCLACMSALHHDRCAELEALFLEYEPQIMNEGIPTAGASGKHFPSSLWLKTNQQDDR